jgi:hypothetical protein
MSPTRIFLWFPEDLWCKISEELAFWARSRVQEAPESCEFLASLRYPADLMQSFGFTPNSQRIHCTPATSTHLRWTEFLSHDDAAFRYDRVRVPRCARAATWKMTNYVGTAWPGAGAPGARGALRGSLCCSRSQEFSGPIVSRYVEQRMVSLVGQRLLLRTSNTSDLASRVVCLSACARDLPRQAVTPK